MSPVRGPRLLDTLVPKSVVAPADVRQITDLGGGYAVETLISMFGKRTVWKSNE